MTHHKYFFLKERKHKHEVSVGMSQYTTDPQTRRGRTAGVVTEHVWGSRLATQDVRILKVSRMSCVALQDIVYKFSPYTETSVNHDFIDLCFWSSFCNQ